LAQRLSFFSEWFVKGFQSSVFAINIIMLVSTNQAFFILVIFPSQSFYVNCGKIFTFTRIL